MKQRILVFTAILFVVFFFVNGTVATGPCDSPNVGGHTGAPGETGCNGCHAGTANTGPAIIDFDLGTTTYVPGQMYTGYVRIQQPGMQKFGFVCLALTNSTLTTIGTFTNINGLRTRTFADGNRNYVGHTPCGADSADANSWTFHWTAPATNVDTITFYLGTLAANHDHALTGDYGYERQLILVPQTTSLQETALDKYILYPNPFNESIYIDGPAVKSIRNISLCSVTGSIIYAGLKFTEVAPGKLKIDDDLQITPGVYLLKIDL